MQLFAGTGSAEDRRPTQSLSFVMHVWSIFLELGRSGATRLDATLFDELHSSIARLGSNCQNWQRVKCL